MGVKKSSAQKLADYKKRQARALAAYEKSLKAKSTKRRKTTTKKVKAVKRIKAKKPRASIKAKKPRKSLKPKKLRTKKTVRRVARAVKKATKKPFAGGLTKQVAKGYKAVKEFFTKPRTTADKETRLAQIGIKLYKSRRKRTAKQKRKISKLYSDFAEFTGRRRDKLIIVTTKKKETLDRAKKSGMAVYEDHIYVHVARAGESAKLGRYLGETVIARTYFGKRERIFLGGADVFDRVVKKLQVKKLPKGEMISGAFFGGPTFHRAIYSSVNEFLNYLNNQFVPHLPKGQKPTKRNIARAKSDLIKNIAIVSIENPEFEDDTDEE